MKDLSASWVTPVLDTIKLELGQVWFQPLQLAAGESRRHGNLPDPTAAFSTPPLGQPSQHALVF